MIRVIYCCYFAYTNFYKNILLLLLNFGFQLSFIFHSTPVFLTWYLLNVYIRLSPNMSTLICYSLVGCRRTHMVVEITSEGRCFLINNSNSASLTANVSVVLSYLMQTNASMMSMSSKEIDLILKRTKTSQVNQADFFPLPKMPTQCHIH